MDEQKPITVLVYDLKFYVVSSSDELKCKMYCQFDKIFKISEKSNHNIVDKWLKFHSRNLIKEVDHRILRQSFYTD